MHLTLFKKLFISLLVLASLMVLGMAWLINHSFQSGLQDYLNKREVEKLEVIATQIEQYYSIQNGWLVLQNNPIIWERILLQTFSPKQKTTKNMQRQTHNRIKHLHERIQLFDKQMQPLYTSQKPINIKSNLAKLIKLPLHHEQEIVGWVTMLQRQEINDALASSFYEQQKQNFYWIAGWIILFSFVVAWFLVRHFLTPLKQLSIGAKALQQGDYQSLIRIKGNDEFSDLSLSFNELSNSLQQQKNNREQWLADISHELRTPLSVLKSEIEALQDGIRQPEPRYINSLHDQVENLTQLVNDLYQLSLSDAGLAIELNQQVNITQLLVTTCQQYELRLQEKQLTLHYQIDETTPLLIQGDQKSLAQLLSNLFENSYRYTDGDTEHPGQVLVNLSASTQGITLTIEDSSPGVPDHALNKLFQRLYRVDKSRSRLSGGSGLGLSICEKIVHLHGGQITASHSDLGGLKISLHLPYSEH